MIGKAKAIAHGHALISYITGESASKKHPEKVFRICENFMPPHLDADSIYDAYKLHCSNKKLVQNTVIRIEISPSPEHTKHFTKDDWKRLWDDFVTEFDKERRDADGKIVLKATTLGNTKSITALHLESESGIPHLHAAACRVDMDGNTIDDHNIHIRAQRAAEQVALKRGWKTAMDVREANIEKVNADCYSVLKSMSRWSWYDYTSGLEAKGYDVHVRQDSNGNYVGYTLAKGNAKYRASQLGKGRNLMLKNLQKTWMKMHPKPVQEKPAPVVAKPAPKPVARPVERPVRPISSPSVQPERRPVQPPSRFISLDWRKYLDWQYDYRKLEVSHEGKDMKFYIPEKAACVFDDQFDYQTVLNWEALTQLATAYFVGLMQPDVVPSAGGGGGSNESGWGRDKDDDDERWARRCAQAAAHNMGIQKRTKYKRN